jgi:hypothetical protein
MFPAPTIPGDWSPEQALAVYEFLDVLRERVWDRYQEQIIDQYRAYCGAEEKDDAQLLLPEQKRGYLPLNCGSENIIPHCRNCND